MATKTTAARTQLNEVVSRPRLNLDLLSARHGLRFDVSTSRQVETFLESATMAREPPQKKQIGLYTNIIGLTQVKYIYNKEGKFRRWF